MITKAYHDRDGKIWFDGQFVDWRDSKGITEEYKAKAVVA